MQDSTADSDLPKGVGIPKEPVADDDVEEKGKKQSEYWSRARMPRSLNNALRFGMAYHHPS